MTKSPRAFDHVENLVIGSNRLSLQKMIGKARAISPMVVHVDEWLEGDRVGFVPETRSPMGYGLGAAPREAPEAISMDEAAEKVLERAKGDHS